MKRAMILVVGLLVAVICIRLGIWQVRRLQERRERNRHAEQQLALPILLLDSAVARSIALDPDAYRFRSVRASGRFDFARELVVIARSHRGVPGVHLVTPLVIDDSIAVLVERGWLASPDSRTIPQGAAPEPAAATVEGVLLRADGRALRAGAARPWPRRVVVPDPAQVGSWYPYRLVPMLLRRHAPPSGSPLRAVELPERSAGPHLSYAVQWFAFATIAVAGSVILFVRRGAETRPAHPSASPKC